MRAKEVVEKFHAYSAPLEGRRGKLRLDFNESTIGPSPKVLEVLRNLPPDAYATYPEYAGLAEQYAALVGAAPNQVGLFNGADAAIRAIFDAFGEPGARFLSTTPTFGYYSPCAALQGMQEQLIPYQADLSYPSQAIREALAEQPRLLFICNPNNPTGTLLQSDTILELARVSPETLLVVDELYAEFTGISVLPQALGLPNVVALRSLSKTYGLAGLRLGFAIGPSDIIERLDRVTGPYDVNTLAVIAAKVALEDQAHVQQLVSQIREAKRFTELELESRKLRFHSEGGNYLLVWPDVPTDPLAQALDALDIRVRSMSGKPLIDGSFRLSIGTLSQMRQFFAAFDRVRRELGA